MQVESFNAVSQNVGPLPILAACWQRLELRTLLGRALSAGCVRALELLLQSILDVLKKYKYQPFLEKRHSLLKTTLEVAPVFLKKKTRNENSENLDSCIGRVRLVRVPRGSRFRT